VERSGFLVLVNDEIRGRIATPGRSAGFACECGSPGCSALVEATGAWLDSARAANLHVLAPGHVVFPPIADDGASDGADLAVVRAALTARVQTSWRRLEDAVSELHALHDVPQEAIVKRVEATVDLETRS
jgi:hypothetical protein